MGTRTTSVGICQQLSVPCNYFLTTLPSKEAESPLGTISSMFRKTLHSSSRSLLQQWVISVITRKPLSNNTVHTSSNSKSWGGKTFLLKKQQTFLLFNPISFHIWMHEVVCCVQIPVCVCVSVLHVHSLTYGITWIVGGDKKTYLGL